MSIHAWFRLPRVRRGLAVSLVVLSTGGLVLARTPAGAGTLTGPETHVALAGGSNSAAFRGPGVSGRFALSHTKVLARGEQRVFAEIDLKADAAERRVERAPLAMAIVLDTSGSMGGEKIDQAKRSAVQMIREMRDDDQIAFVRYASDTELVQPLAPVGLVREALIARINAISASGGTNIPPALSQGLAALATAGGGRVKRVVLASDGLDSSRAIAEQVAREAAAQGVTISSMGIGLDFDEGYMGGVAVAGHGNFAFVKDASTLATFLHRELQETATTMAQNVTARVRLPDGFRFVQAIGATGRMDPSGELVVSAGSLFAGDERRVIVELAASVPIGQTRGIEGAVTWTAVGGDTATARFGGVAVSGSDDALAVDEGRDGAVLANATSVLASTRQIAAAEAYARGDTAQAQALVDQNMHDLKAAEAAAPAAAAPVLAAQARAYGESKRVFAAPRSAGNNAAVKAGAAKDFDNMGRNAAF
ncbi:MAG: VWA domain-containing protein [Minicystis sp.]